MIEKVTKSIVNNMSNIKKQFHNDAIVDDKVSVSETATITDNSELSNHVTNTIKKENEILLALDDIKIELSLSEIQILNDNVDVKVEEGICADAIKSEFKKELLFCEHCQLHYQDYCIECGMLVHILNRNVLKNTDNKTWDELPNDILEIQNSVGQFGVFASRVIPKDVHFGPFTGLRDLEGKWKLKGGRFIVDWAKSNYLNWLRYVNPARTVSEQNMLPFQYDGNLYCRSTRKIEIGEELLVYFEEEYEENLNKDVEVDFTPRTEECIKDIFACTFCCLGFSSIAYLAKHKTICLNDADGKFSVEEITRCSFCNVYLDEREYNKYHMAYCSKRNVRECIPLTPNDQALEVRGTKIRRPRRQLHKCSQCKYRTAYKGELKSHANKHWRAQSKKKCYTKRHVQREHFECVSCDFKTKYKTSLKRHIKTKHSNESKYKCEMCEYKSKWKAYLEKHIKTRHLKEFNYKCEMCEYKTDRKTDLQRHIKRKHLSKVNYECEICEYKSNLKGDLEIHIRTRHLKEYNYKCEMCEYKTNRKAKFEKHVKVKHLKKFKYKCEVCEYKANTKASIEMHVKTKHLKEFNFKCEMCQYKTNRKSNLEQHIKAIHLKEYSYKCKSCLYQTNCKTVFEKHVKIQHVLEA